MVVARDVLMNLPSTSTHPSTDVTDKGRLMRFAIETRQAESVPLVSATATFQR